MIQDRINESIESACSLYKDNLPISHYVHDLGFIKGDTYGIQLAQKVHCKLLSIQQNFQGVTHLNGNKYPAIAISDYNELKELLNKISAIHKCITYNQAIILIDNILYK